MCLFASFWNISTTIEPEQYEEFLDFTSSFLYSSIYVSFYLFVLVLVGIFATKHIELKSIHKFLQQQLILPFLPQVMMI